MQKHIAQFFKFLEDKGEKRAPLKLKLLDPQTWGKPTKEDLNVKGALNLRKTSIKELPKGLQVGGYLWLSGCKSLKELPQGLIVGQNLYLNGCVRLGKLPQGLKVGKHLNLTDCTSLEKLPQDLQVGEDLDLEGCISLKELPQGLQVGGYLWLYETPIAKKYSEEEIRSMIEDGEGFVNGAIFI